MKNSVGNVYSKTVTLTISPKPVITVQPKSAAVSEGKKVTFKVAAENADTYQWYYRKSASGTWQKCSGSSSATASRAVTAAAKYNGYQYRCLVKNSAGSVYSETVTLTVKPSSKPVITSQPKNTTVDEGAKATFKVVATGADSYQWYARKSAAGTWQKCSGSSAAASFSVTATNKHNGYQYRCLLKNGAGSVYSSTVTLTVNLKPVITVQPKAASVTAGKKAAFNVTATGADSYQWYYRTSATGTWRKSTASAAATAAFSFTAAARHNGYQYRCLVKNGVGSVYTNTVTLTVQ